MGGAVALHGRLQKVTQEVDRDIAQWSWEKLGRTAQELVELAEQQRVP